MDTRNAAQLVQDARGTLTQALADATVCRLDFNTFDALGEARSLAPMPGTDALRDALTALDSALAELDGFRNGPATPVVEFELVYSPLEVPRDAIFSRIPEQRTAVQPV